MRNISFMLTTSQFIDGTKDVTRRLGWTFADVGMELCAVEKSQGLGKGGKIKRLGTIRLVGVRREPLSNMTRDTVYGHHEVVREGFPGMSPKEFVEFFCWSHKGCKPSTIITRLEFVKVNG